jgi:hypothetical protein
MHAPRQRERRTCRTLRPQEIVPVHRRRAVRKHHAVEHQRPADAVAGRVPEIRRRVVLLVVGDRERIARLPVVRELHGEGGERGAGDELVHGGVVAPVVGVRVREEDTPGRGEGGGAGRGDERVEGRVRAPEAEEELGGPVVVVRDELRAVVGEPLGFIQFELLRDPLRSATKTYGDAVKPIRTANASEELFGLLGCDVPHLAIGGLPAQFLSPTIVDWHAGGDDEFARWNGSHIIGNNVERPVERI